MKITREITINRSIENVWEVIGNQFAEVHLWSSNFKNSKSGGAPGIGGLDFAHRVTITDRGETIQVLDEFDPKNHLLAYHITKGIPEVAISASSIWSLKSIDPNTTVASFVFVLEPQGFVKKEMLPKLEAGLVMSAEVIGEELKHYLETGNPHPRKLNDL